MITQVSVKNFKCLRDVTVNLEPFTVFVGANGSGKTSFLQALDLLCRTFRLPHAQRETAGELHSNRTHGSSEDVELLCLSGGTHFRYRQSVKPPTEYHHDWSGNGAGYAKDDRVLEWRPWDYEFTRVLPEPLWLRLDPTYLRSSTVGQDIRQMGNRGEGMHRALCSMMLEQRHDFFKLESDLSRIVPSVKRLQPTAEHEIRFDTINGKGLSASQVSEGTLLTLGLLTAIYCMNKPGILLLDDLDRALHPKAQRELIDLLRGVQETNPEIQIVASTHSPYMLDKMTPKEVMVTFLRNDGSRDDGSTVCEPITHHPNFEKWKDELHPGEMWSYFGEEWVAKTEAVESRV